MPDEGDLVEATKADLARRREQAQAKLDELGPMAEAANAEARRLNELVGDAKAVVEAADAALAVLDGAQGSYRALRLAERRSDAESDLAAIKERFAGGDVFTIQHVIQMTGMNYTTAKRTLDAGTLTGEVRVVEAGAGRRPTTYRVVQTEAEAS